MIQITKRLLSTKKLSDDHCVFRSSSSFLGGNYSLCFAKFTTTLAFSNSTDFHFSKYVKYQMAKNCIKALLEIKRRNILVLALAFRLC